MIGDGHSGLIIALPVKRPAVDERSRTGPSLAIVEVLIGTVHLDDAMHRQFVAPCKSEIPFIMSRHSHHGTCAVVSENVVSDPDRHLLAVGGIDSLGTDGDSSFRSILCCALIVGECIDKVAEGRNGIALIGRGQCINEWMLRCQNDVTHPKQGVRPGGEHRDRRLLVTLNLKVDLGTDRASDPVGLHGADPFRPSVQQLQIVEQCIGVLRDFQEPLLQVLLFNKGSRTP